MDDPEHPFSISLIIATRGRVATLAPRLPLWTGSGFDEVIVVDGSYDTEHRRQIRELCESIGAVWLPAPVRFRDTRSLSRNLGARRARGTWILFRDDDSPVLQSINKGALGKAAAGRDWLVNADAQIITLQRRDAFLAFGGYPEDMVHAEDSIMSNRARGHGVGGREPAWYKGVVTFPPPPEDPISRARNAFWYGYTLLLFLMRTPLRDQVVVGDARRFAHQLRRAPRETRQIVYLVIGLFGRVISPLHSLGVLLRSGVAALRQEPYHGWQGIRSDPPA